MEKSVTSINIPEIVAPVGSPECFSAALNARADAVYVGVREYNMRAGAKAWDSSNIKELKTMAHDAGVKLFCALNVIIFDDELPEIARILDNLADSGIDAVILCDMGVLRLAKDRGLDVHLSTQASVSNSDAVRMYESLGVKRIVLARELSITQIKETISSLNSVDSNMTFECFVHGAMCIAVSGRCLMSRFLHNRSANRGDCLQPCRRTYRVFDDEHGHEMILDGQTVMSAMDLCSIDILDRIMDTGVSALKIEGRMRDARYVKTTVECYREARDAVLDGSYCNTMAEELKKRLSGVFNRGFSHGFYLNRPDTDIADTEGNVSTEVKEYAGRVINYYKRAGAADVRLEARGIATGDKVVITGPTTGAVEFTVSSIRSHDNRQVTQSNAGETIGLKTHSLVRAGDSVYALVPRKEK